MLRSGDEGKVASVFTRGTESDQTLVLFDGVRLNSPYVGGYDVGLLTTSGIERVEVARGPYSALWGADAIGGVINVIPRVGLGGFSATLLGEGGGTAGSATRATSPSAARPSASSCRASTARARASSTTPTSRPTSSSSTSAGASATAAGSRSSDRTSRPRPASPSPSPGNRHPSAASSRTSASSRCRCAGRSGRVWTLELTASEVTREFRFSDPDDPFGITDSRTDADTRQARFSSHHILGTHTLTWGGEWREDEVTDVSNLGTNLDGRTTEVTSAFVQEVWRAGDRVQLIAGTRWDDTEEWGSETSPRAHIGWQLSDTVEMRVGYGKAFRQPSLGELYFPIYGNPELEPETSSSYEIGFVQAPKKGTGRWQLNVFKTELEDLIQYDFASSTSRNIAQAEILGAELAFDSALTADFSQLIQLTWLDTEDDAGDPLLRRPEWSGGYTLTGSFWRRVRGDLTVLYLGSRWDVDPATFERVELGGSATVDLALAWQVRDWLELTARAVNLLDREYQAVRGYPAPGCRVMGGLRLRLGG